MTNTFASASRARVAALLAGAVLASLAVAACGSSSSSSSSASSSNAAASSGSSKHLKIAYMSFAVANSYDAPMLAAAQAVAADNNATLTVFDANNDPNKQFSQLQDAITSGGFDGIITQPIESTNLIPLVQQAIGKHIKVVNIDQIIGPKLDTFENAGARACRATSRSCRPTSARSSASSSCRPARRTTSTRATSATSTTSRRRRSTSRSARALTRRSPRRRRSRSSPGSGLLHPGHGPDGHPGHAPGQPDLSLIAGSDQGIEGASQAIGKKKVVLVGYGGSAAGVAGVKLGRLVRDDRAGTRDRGPGQVRSTLVQALRHGSNDSAAMDPLAGLPDGGVITKSNASQFHPEWPG